MQTDMSDVRSELAAITKDLATAQRRLREIKRKRDFARRSTVVLGATAFTAMALASWALFAQQADEGPPPTQVKAPFKVVDKSGKPIFVVKAGESRGAYVFNTAGAAVGSITAVKNGAMVKTMKANAPGTAVEMACYGTGADETIGFLVMKGGLPKVEMSQGTLYGGEVAVFGAGKQPLAALETYGGSKGKIVVYNSAGKPVAHLAESDKVAGAGRVTITWPDGEGAFSAGAVKPPEGADACERRNQWMFCLGEGVMPLAVYKDWK